MNAALQWGLDFVRLAQGQANPALVFFMRGVSALGSVAALAGLVALVYWCVDERKGLRLGALMLLSAWLNIVLKLLLDQPRPFDLDPALGLVGASLGGLPSGHAQNTLVMLFALASFGKAKTRIFFIPALALCLLVGFSRVFLGAHFPTDVLGGWLVGAVLLCAYFVFGDRVEALLDEHAPRAGLIAAAALSFVMILHRPSALVLAPAGALLGMGVGFHLSRKYASFVARMPIGRREPVAFLILLARFALGAAGAVFLFVFSENIIDALRGPANLNYELFVFARFALVALWISAGAPLLFRALRLVDSNVIHYQEHD